MTLSRKAAHEALLRIAKDGAYSSLVLSAAEDKYSLSVSDKAFVHSLLFGTLERLRILDRAISLASTVKFSKIDAFVLAALRLCSYELLFLKSPPHAAIYEAVELVKKSKFNRYSGFANGVLRKISTFSENEILQKCPAAQRDAVRYSVSDGLYAMLRDYLGKEDAKEQIERSFGAPPVTLRVNTLAVTPEKLLDILSELQIDAAPSPFLENALDIRSPAKLFSAAEKLSGLFHVQDLSSQLCCEALAPLPDQTVLDLCSAPGSKSFTLAQMMGGQGQLFAFDLHEKRVELIRKGAQQLGIINIQASQSDSSVFDPSFSRSADRVLCDVPCSGFGTLRRKPEIRYKDPKDFNELIYLQRKILLNAADYLKPKGRLVYSTCTLNPQENEENVAFLLAERSDLIPCPLSEFFAKNVSECGFYARILTKYFNSDGFFLALFEKKE